MRAPSPFSPPLICIACWNAWTGPINRGALLCFGCKQGEGGCHIIWFAWYENSGGLQSMEPVVYLGWNEIFLLGCLHLDAICQLYCGRPGSILARFYSKFVMGPIQGLKVNMVIYLHAHKQTHFVRHFWWLLEWRSHICAGSWCEGSLSEWLGRGREGLPAALHVTDMGNIYYNSEDTPKVCLTLAEWTSMCFWKVVLSSYTWFWIW